MVRALVLIGVMLSLLASCGRVAESRFNPLNWFGRSESTATEATAASQEAQNLVAQVISLRAEPVAGGAIVRATGLPQRQGYFDGALVEIPSDDATVLSFEFQIEQPFTQTGVGPQQSREVIVGIRLSDQTLQGVRLIRVNGATNALSIRR